MKVQNSRFQHTSVSHVFKVVVPDDARCTRIDVKKKIITGAAHRIVINSCHVFNFDVFFFFIKVLFCGRTAVDIKELRLSFITPPSLFVHHESDWKIFSSLMKWNVCGHVVMLENIFFGYMLLFATHNVVTSSDP